VLFCCQYGVILLETYMKTILRAAGVFVMLVCLGMLLGGCTPVVSVRPLYTEADANQPYLDQRIEGAWIMPIEDDSNHGTPKPPCDVTIARASGAGAPYTVGFRCPDDEGRHYTEHGFYLVQSHDLLFFDAQFRKSEEKGKQISVGDIDAIGIAPAHLIGQIWIQQDFVRFSAMGSDWVEKNWPPDFLVAGKFEKSDQVDILTNSTEDLREALSRNAESPEAFDLPLYLCRAGADCIARATEDQLKRTPDNTDVLAESVRFYSSRGDFARAVALQKHKIALKKEAGNDQFTLGELLLFGGDFPAAREAFAGTNERAAGETVKQLVVLSYFLQGDYAGTIQAEKTMSEPKDRASADPIILSYFARHRLGQAKQADAFLHQKADTFVGPGRELIFLHDLLGQVTDSLSSTADQHRTTFYYALNRLKNRDVEDGRGHLQDLVRELSKDDLLSFAARVELQRLPGAPATSAK